MIIFFLIFVFFVFYILAEISLSENQSIPNEILFNIARIFKVYCDGVNIGNYLIIYYVS